MQDLQEWAEQSQSSEDYKQLTLETFEAAPQWLAERRVKVKWKPLSISSDMERKSSICLRVQAARPFNSGSQMGMMAHGP